MYFVSYQQENLQRTTPVRLGKKSNLGKQKNDHSNNIDYKSPKKERGHHQAHHFPLKPNNPKSLSRHHQLSNQDTQDNKANLVFEMNPLHTTKQRFQGQ